MGRTYRTGTIMHGLPKKKQQQGALLKVIVTVSFFTLILSFFCETGKTYPNYISFGYQSCLSCHYNPNGNGPLTDYGRAVGATALSDRIFWSRKKSEESIANSSGFLFKKPTNTWLRPSLNYRGLYIQRNYGQTNSQSDYVHMDAGGSLVAKFFDDRLTIVGQLSYAPVPRSLAGQKDVVNYRTREHYIGYRFSKTIGVYVGLLDKVFGIRVPDHTAFSRSVTALSQNDQTHGAVINFLKDKYEVTVQPFIGNLVQDKAIRQKGFTGQFEYSLNETARIGTSLLRSQSSFQSQNLMALHARLGAGKGNSVLFEIGQAEKSIKGGASLKSQYIFMQNHLMLKRGLFAFLTVEALKPDTMAITKIYRYGPGIQYFPMQRVELRADFYNTHTADASSFTNDSWDLTGQIHLWF